jgi:hypothetical protein
VLPSHAVPSGSLSSDAVEPTACEEIGSPRRASCATGASTSRSLPHRRATRRRYEAMQPKRLMCGESDAISALTVTVSGSHPAKAAQIAAVSSFCGAQAISEGCGDEGSSRIVTARVKCPWNRTSVSSRRTPRMQWPNWCGFALSPTPRSRLTPRCRRYLGLMDLASCVCSNSHDGFVATDMR